MTTSTVATGQTAEAVCRLFKPTPAARAMIVPGLPASVLFYQLVGLGLYADARRLLAHALPPRRAVWWAALCLHDSGLRKPFYAPEEEAALATAIRWVIAPGEAARRAAGAAGWVARPHTAAGQLALATFLTGGSMSRPGLPPVYPEPHLCGRLCGVVVYLASVRFDPARYKNYLRQYLEVGLEIARGLNLPPGGTAEEPPPEAPAAPAWTDLDQLTAHVMGYLHNSGAFREDDTSSNLLMSAARPPASAGG